ncbi:MAG: HNH endonuclease [Alphaproteobacteria bacterium]|nr:HNH endonuclease [Alphaproteobacteria bacterium]
MYSSAVERLIECKIYIENNMPTAVLDYQQRHEKEVASYQQHLFISPPMGNPKPEKINAPDSHYIKRDPKVSAYVKQRADGTCECCHHAAPFQKLDGELFLEIHHMKPLAQGGSDTVANAIAICPNCHRELHHGAKRDSLIEKIYLEHTSIERE